MSNTVEYIIILAFLVGMAVVAVVYMESRPDTDELWREDLSEAVHDAGAYAVIEPPFGGSEPLSVASLAFSNDGQFLAGTSSDGIHVWSTIDGAAVGPNGDRYLQIGLGGSGPVAYSADNGRLATVSETGAEGKVYVMVWDTRSGKRVYDVEANAPRIVALSFSPTGRRLTLAFGTGLNTWDLEAGTSTRKQVPELQRAAWMTTPDEKQSVVTLAGNTIEHRDPITLDVAREVEVDSQLDPIGFIGNGQYLLLAHRGRAVVFSTLDGEIVANLEGLGGDISAACSPSRVEWVALGVRADDGSSSLVLWRTTEPAPYALVERLPPFWSLACGEQGRIAMGLSVGGAIWNEPDIAERFATRPRE